MSSGELSANAAADGSDKTGTAKIIVNRDTIHGFTASASSVNGACLVDLTKTQRHYHDKLMKSFGFIIHLHHLTWKQIFLPDHATR